MSRFQSFLQGAKQSFSKKTEAFGSTSQEKFRFLAFSVAGSTVAGVALSELVFTDERIQKATNYLESGIQKASRKAQSMGLPLPSFLVGAHAFSTADHGLHAPHFPWEFEKFYKTFDHAAYVFLRLLLTLF